MSTSKRHAKSLPFIAKVLAAKGFPEAGIQDLFKTVAAEEIGALDLVRDGLWTEATLEDQHGVYELTIETRAL